MILGVLAFWGGSRLPAVPGQDVGPAAFPMVIGAGPSVCTRAMREPVTTTSSSSASCA